MGELQALVETALEWRNLVRLMWVETGRPPVPGFAASRVQQILWGEQPPEEGFFSALLGALTSRSRAGADLWLWRNALVHPSDSDAAVVVREAAKLIARRDAQQASALAGGEQEADRPTGEPSEAAAVSVSAVALESLLADDDSGLSMWDRVKMMFEERPPDPGAVETEAEFMAALRRLKERTTLSFRQLEEHSKTTTGGWLPRSSAADMLRRETVPKADLLWAFTAALGLSKEEQDRWEAARSRMETQRRTPRRLEQSIPMRVINNDIDEYTSFAVDVDDHNGQAA